MHKLDNEFEPTAQDRELYSVLGGDWAGKEIQKRGEICIHMVEPLCGTAETDNIVKLLYTQTKEKQRHKWTSMRIVALFTTAKIWKSPECSSTDDWIEKELVYMNHGMWFSHEETRYIQPSVTSQVNSAHTELCELSQTEKDKHCMSNLTHET